MKNYIEKLKDLANKYPNDVRLYPPKDLKNLAKLPGKIPGSFNKQIFDFLKVTNGASILDYCFYGYQNPKLGLNIEKNSVDYWVTHNHIAGLIIPFMSSSSGQNFGYLIKWTETSNQPIVYFTDDPRHTTLIASSFDLFLQVFLIDVEECLKRGEDIEVDIQGWPTDFTHWLEADPSLKELKDHPLVLETVNSI
jgi:hypothetical protein